MRKGWRLSVRTLAYGALPVGVPTGAASRHTAPGGGTVPERERAPEPRYRDSHLPSLGSNPNNNTIDGEDIVAGAEKEGRERPGRSSEEETREDRAPQNPGPGPMGTGDEERGETGPMGTQDEHEEEAGSRVGEEED